MDATMMLDGEEVPLPPAVAEQMATAVRSSPPPVPEVALFQCRILLSQMPSRSGDAGKTFLDDVDAAIKAQGGPALIAWEYGNTVARSGPLVLAMAAEFHLSDAELDALFEQAAQIVV